MEGRVSDQHRLRIGIEGPREMEPLGAEKAGGEGQPLRAVVVPRDDEHRHATAPDQAVQSLVQEGHGLLGWDRTVVEVPGQNQGFGPGLPGHGHDLIQDVGLIIQQVGIAEGLAQVPVGSMEEAHGGPQGAVGHRLGVWHPGRGSFQADGWGDAFSSTG